MTTLQADFLLILVVLGWGISYVFMDYCLTDIGQFTLNTFRFLISAFCAFIIRPKYMIKQLNTATITRGLLIGCFLFMTYFCTSMGIQMTSLTNTGFLCSSTVVFTPIFSFIFLKRKPNLKTIVSVIICFIGMAILTLSKGFSFSSETFFGDILCVFCGFFYAFDLLLTEKAVEKPEVDAYTLGTINLLTVGILNLICGLIFEDMHNPTTAKVWAAMLFLSIFATGFAFIIQPIAQKYTTASRVGIIFTLEPLFNVVAAVLILHECLTLRQGIGAAIMIISILILEVDFTSIVNKKK